MSTFEEIHSLIASYAKIAIVGHCLPDGDCYGSQIGLREALRAAFPDKDIRALGSGFAPLFARISPMDEAEDAFFDGALAILVDVSCIRRVEETRISRCAAFLKFDHHDPNRIGEAFDHPSLSFPERSSCCEIVTEFAEYFHMPLSKKAAEALYAGILTDTGRFRFYGVTRQTLDDVAHLLRRGVEPKPIIDILFHEEPQEKAYKKWMRAHAKKRGQVAFLYAEPKDYEAFGLPYEQASEYVNALMGVHHCPIYVYACKKDDSWTRIELRSHQRFPVQPTAMRFGGGGHRYAAGTEIREGNEISLDDLLDALNEVTR